MPVALVVIVGAGPAAAQTTPAAAPSATPLTWSVRNTTRVESWRYFQPNPGGGNPDSTFVGNRLTLTVRARRQWFEGTAALQYVQFGGLPTGASGPGALGTGALYYGLAGRRDSRQLYVRTLSLTGTHAASGLRLQAGRFGLTAGGESPSGDAAIETVKRQRVDARLLGEFEWSLYQRAFDGARLDLDRSRWHASAAMVRPTQGGFEDEAGAPMRGVRVVTASLTAKPGLLFGRTDVQAFVYHYNDARAVRARPDNSGLTAPRIDVSITTLGATLTGAYPAGPGRIDTLLWAVRQTGNWYGQDHDASAVAVEAGYQWPTAPWRPWLRVGLFRGSGDTDPGDSTHGTFFQMLPTGRKYAFSVVYNLMNLTDRFVQLQTRPHQKLSARLDLHRLRLTSAADLWYAGSGATTAVGSGFGYVGRRANNSRDLGWIVEGSADWTVSRRVSLNGYLGRMSGGEVVARLFRGTSLTYGYLESIISF